NISGWQNYVAKYPASQHTDAAKRVLAGLFIDAGNKALASYQKGGSYADLTTARAQMNLAHGVLPNSEREAKLSGEISASLNTLTAKAGSELDAYNAALKSGTAGFAHLENAKSIVAGINQVDPIFAPAQKVRDAVAQANNAYEAAVRSAEAAAQAKQWDEAVKPVQPY